MKLHPAATGAFNLALKYARVRLLLVDRNNFVAGEKPGSEGRG